MARKSWSNVFILLAAVNLALAVAPNNPLRWLDLAAIPAFIVSGAYLRRRMI